MLICVCFTIIILDELIFFRYFYKQKIFLNKIGLANMIDPNYMGLIVNQIQGNVGLTNMSDSKNLDIIDTYYLINDM
jgi:hypothetical protein